MADLTQLLVDEARLTTEEASLISHSIEPFPPGKPGTAFEALKISRQPGKLAIEVTCIKPRNLLVNWKELMFKAVPAAIGAGKLTVAAPLLGVPACLGALYTLIGAASITLGKEHAQVVETLWSVADRSMEFEDLRMRVGDKEAGKSLDRVLDELEELRILTRDENDVIHKWDYLVLN